jgi:hypothetical protein
VLRSLLLLSGLLIAGGCARDRSQAYRGDDDLLAQARPAAAALVFEPSMAGELPEGALAREGREPEAFVGYAEGVAEYFYLRWDDRQSNWGRGGHGGDDRYERRAISEKVGVLYR